MMMMMMMMTCCNVSAAARVLRSQPPSIASAGVDPALSCGVDGASLQSRPPVIHSVSRDLAPPLTVASAFDASVISSQEGDGGSSENDEEGDECSPHLATVNRSATPDRPHGIDVTSPPPTNTSAVGAEHESPGGDTLFLAGLADSQRPVNATSCLEDASARDHFVQSVKAAYEVVVPWRRNLFIVPHGSAGILFVGELSRLINCFADGSDIRCARLFRVRH